MSLIEYDLFGNKHDKVQDALDLLQHFEPPEGYYLAFSGGKDSQTVFHLCKMAGVKFDAHMRLTGVDAPEVIRFAKTYYPEVKREHPHDKDGKPITMWNLIPRKLMPPTRIVRYCCAELKETGGDGRLVVTGVRKQESVARSKRTEIVIIKDRRAAKVAEAENAEYREQRQNGIVMNFDNAATKRTVEQCYRTHKTTINPIADWSEDDVWEFLNDVVKVPHCSLYDEGFKRVGCIGCPMADTKREFERWPVFKNNYIKAFERMIEERKRKGLGVDKKFNTGEEVMKWWIGEKVTADEDQMTMEELLEQLEPTEVVE